MRTVNQIKLIICLTALTLMAATLLTACGTAQAAVETSTAPAASAAPKTSATATRSALSPAGATAASPTATRTIPKLTDISFTLALNPDQAFTENTTPIYLQASQILHLSWVVIKGGDHFFMTFSLPSGKSVAIRANGSLSNYNTGETPEKLYKNGDVVFRPSDNNWNEGYYLFHPQIFQGDPTITVKLLYWIE